MDETICEAFDNSMDTEQRADYLLTNDTFKEMAGNVVVDSNPDEATDEAMEATCEVVDENDVPDEAIDESPMPPPPKKRKQMEASPSPSLPAAATSQRELSLASPLPKIAIATLDVLSQIMHDKEIGWTTQACTRFLHVFIHLYNVIPRECPHLFFLHFRARMFVAESDEPLLSESYIHKDDLQRFRDFMKQDQTKKSDVVYRFRTNFDVDLSIEKIKKVCSYFYDLEEGFFFEPETKVFNFKMSAGDVPEKVGSRKSNRERKTRNYDV